MDSSLDREVSLGYAMEALTSEDKVGIVFEMSIDSFVSSTPFAAIGDVSYFQTEKEGLLSMHTVFRIGEIKQMDNHDSLYRVKLHLTSDDDQQLRRLTERIRTETSGSTGWERLGRLLLKIGHFDKAEELYNTLLEQTSDGREKALYYHQLASVKDNQGDSDRAIWYNEKTLEIWRKTLPPNHPSLATSYNNIGLVYNTMGEYSKALSFYEKALEILQKILPPSHPHIQSIRQSIRNVRTKL